MQNMLRSQRNDAITVIEINDSVKFREMDTEWSCLLQNTLANKLFLSWHWQYSWWEAWAEELGLSLILLKAYRGNELVGIAPLYLDSVCLRGTIPIKRVQFIGNAWGRQGTVRTEYLEFILSRDGASGVARAFLEYMSKLDIWDEFIICDSIRCSATYQQLSLLKHEYKWFVSEIELV